MSNNIARLLEFIYYFLLHFEDFKHWFYIVILSALDKETLELLYIMLMSN